MNRWCLFIIFAFGSALLAAPAESTEGKGRSKTFLSDVFLINKFYRSMEGPLQVKKFALDPTRQELLWIKKIKVQVVDQDGITGSHQDFFCHFNVDFDVPQRRKLLPNATIPSHRLLTMSQGQMEISFPENAALPIHSQEELTFYFQVLNRKHEGTFYVRHRVTIDFIENRELKNPMLPLFAHAGMVIQSLSPKVVGWEKRPEDKICGRALSVGDRYPTGMGYIQDSLGNKFTSHWKVPPGKQESATPLNSFMPLPYKTTLHGFSPHVHAYAQKLSIFDARTGTELVNAKVQTAKDSPVLELIEYLSFPVSSQVTIDETPSYEMFVSYDNPTNQDQDAMAMAVCYFHDRTFKGDKVMTPDLLALHRQTKEPDLVGCSLIPSNVPLDSPAPKLPEMKVEGLTQ